MQLKPIEDSLFKDLPDDLKQTLKLSGVVPVADPIFPLWNLPKGTNTVILIGGRGGMKTYGVSDFTANNSSAYKKRFVVLRDEKSHIKDSILSEILQRFDEIPFYTGTERMQTGLKDSATSVDVVFTKGFKASDNKKKANMKGISNIDYAIVEEAEDIIDADKFNTFIDSLRKEGCVLIILMNTPDIGHFLLKTYFDCNTPCPVPKGIPPEMIKDCEGYYEIKPKKIPGFVCIQTGFEDNRFLPQHIIDRYNAYGDPNSHLFNLHYYLTAIKGYASTGRKGQIHKKVKPISLADYMALPFKEYYGQDFGTAAPAGLSGVKFDKNNLYCRELNYIPMNALELGKLYCKLKFNHTDRIVADNADEKTWRKLRRGWLPEELSPQDLKAYPGLVTGFNIVPCVKTTLTDGIDLLDTFNIFAVKESLNLWEETRMRIYAQDKNGNYINEPEPGYDHLWDGIMYVANDQRGKKKFKITTQ